MTDTVMTYRFEDYELDTRRFELRRSGEPCRLERQVFDVLAYLVENHERVVPKEEIVERVWGDRFVSESALNSRIMAARKAIGDSGKEQRLIKTVHGRGYRFVGDVTESAGPGAEPPTQVPVATAAETPAPRHVDRSVRYCTTSDGVRIAYWSLGGGEALVEMPSTTFSHIGREWDFPEIHDWYSQLAARWQLVRYDNRGSGLSQREPLDFSVEASIRDLEAVLDVLGLRQAAIFAAVSAGQAAIEYAARHPDRVSKLILWCAFARGTDFFDLPEIQTVRPIVERDWRLYTETAAHERLGWSEGAAARRFAELIRDAVTPEAHALLMDTRRAADVSHLLPKVRVPTLVLHREAVWSRLAVAQRLASEIPEARLAVLEGSSLAPYLGNAAELLGILEEFLGRSARAPEAGVHTILFTDVEGSTSLTERLGDEGARRLLREHERIVRESLAAHDGSEVKSLGDGFMVSFPSATRAVQCAIAIQRTCREETPDVKVRIGINSGEPIAEGEDLFGTAVNMAARVAGQALGGEILVTDVVRQLVAGKGFAYTNRGPAKLRGFDEPVTLYTVEWA